MRDRRSTPVALVIWLALGGCRATAPGPAAARGPEPAPTPVPTVAPIAPPIVAPIAPPTAVTEYLGRTIAPTMHWSGAAWLERSERQQEEDVAQLLRSLGVRAGMTVCDLGCGSGHHAIRLAAMVQPGGRVIGSDLQPEMLALARRSATTAGVENFTTIEAAPHDPRFPAGVCDRVLMVDVYHELSHPEPVLAHVRAALSARGRVALVEFRGEDPAVPIQPLHKLTRAQAVREFTANGFVAAGSHDGLPWQHLLFFSAGRSR